MFNLLEKGWAHQVFLSEPGLSYEDGKLSNKSGHMGSKLVIRP